MQLKVHLSLIQQQPQHESFAVCCAALYVHLTKEELEKGKSCRSMLPALADQEKPRLPTMVADNCWQRKNVFQN